ncbi:MAG: hypothetical protein DMF88_20520 [Acidobacteria bacterium]|nr:MAG: hypothetical protein DMF88_20520 [Acidobacteriota bacterium]
MTEEDAGEYCRQVEQYLCRRNEGHLIRISGPRFDLVQGWFSRGIPLKIAMQGIDRGVERRRAKDTRRRPVPIEFCEDDVLDVFEEWKRSVGVSEAGRAGGAGEAGRESLPGHLERVIAHVLRELDTARAKAKTIRGDGREALIERLRQLDAALVGALRQHANEQTVRQLAADADEELKPFRARMPAETYQQSHRACIDRLLRERAGLPTIAYE